MEIYRGDIYYIDKSEPVGSEQGAGRPAVVVSNDQCNQNSPVVEVVYLTTQPKTDLPTHVVIRSSTRESTALCEQISSVSTSRIGDYIGSVTDDEMRRINMALLVSLDLYIPPESETLLAVEETVVEPISDDIAEIELELARAEAQRDTYRSMYDTLLDRIFSERSN